MSDIVRWTDYFGEEHVLMEGKKMMFSMPSLTEETGKGTHTLRYYPKKQ